MIAPLDGDSARTSGAGRLFLVCGLPGAGKTTLARELERTFDAVRLCPDDWLDVLAVNLHDEVARARVETLQWQMARRLLDLGVSVVIEWGTWGRSERDTLRAAARSAAAPVELHYVSATPEVLFERIQRRGREDPPITWETVLGWAALFESPTAEEMAMFDPQLSPRT